jgi:peptidoglycan hydrolase-like protein with peptidoglycan-binding domain
VQFTNAVQWFAYGEPGALKRRLLLTPHTSVVLPRTSPAGTELISAAPRIWETAPAAPISWFPAGTQRASAVASPSPGSIVGPDTPITLTFSEPVADALGGHLPPVSPVTTGSWHTISPHTIVFQPEGYGYGLGAAVTVPLPGGVQLVGGHQSNSGSVASWSVPPGSTLRLQQLLALLGYLPVTFHPAGLGGIALTPHAQEQAAVHPPGGAFAWRYPNTPGALKSFWQPGAEGTVTRGAVMAFENDQGITPDGIAGAAVWRALIGAAIAGKRSPFGYTFASVSEGSPETLSLWHNGSTILTTPVNTGVAGAPTATGLYPVFEHIASGTMSGTNPDGSHYVDPGIPWISYFNGGDALHGFIRPGYGYPQSDGCVEMPPATAGRVWPYTPIGTLVNVT